LAELEKKITNQSISEGIDNHSQVRKRYIPIVEGSSSHHQDERVKRSGSAEHLLVGVKNET